VEVSTESLEEPNRPSRHVGTRPARATGTTSRSLPAIAPGTTGTFDFRFYDAATGGSEFGSAEGDFLVVSVVHDVGTTGTYFASPE
jgi:hypothetical protein